MLEVYKIDPKRIVYKLTDVSDLQEPVWPGDWDIERRALLSDTEKFRSIQQRANGARWEDTDIFRGIYVSRMMSDDPVHGYRSIEALAKHYYERYDAMFEDLRANGFRERVDGVLVKLPKVYLGRDGAVFLSNEGNHRVAMAQIIGLPFVLVQVQTRHPDAPLLNDQVRIDPVMPDSVTRIPAMTTPAEQYACYEVAKKQAPHGQIVELGVWLGAVTAPLAAGVRDAGAPTRVHAHDRFEWKDVHTIKAGGALTQPMIQQVQENLGPLSEFVVLHRGDFREARWDGQPISALVLDGPKRVKELTITLPRFGCLTLGASIVVQDYAHFPSYDLPAAFYRLETAGVLRFRYGVFPGTMAIFEAIRPIEASDVNEKSIGLARWTPDEIESTWQFMAKRLPERMRPRFHFGAVLFLYDRGYMDAAMRLFRNLLQDHREAFESKWKMIRDTRQAFINRYPLLTQELCWES